jgi:ATP-dependent Lon protease
VLPIGGLKEKLLAALRAGIKTVLIPKDNEKDLSEIPDNAIRGLEIIPLDTVDEILRLALVAEPTPIEWTEPPEVEAARSVQDKDEHSGLVRH